MLARLVSYAQDIVQYLHPYAALIDLKTAIVALKSHLEVESGLWLQNHGVEKVSESLAATFVSLHSHCYYTWISAFVLISNNSSMAAKIATWVSGSVQKEKGSNKLLYIIYNKVWLVTFKNKF